MMSSEINKVQESITIALDAADAAAEVTSEYNRVKQQHKKLENSVKSVHRYIILIFGSSMLAAIAALVFASMLYFRTMSELTPMTTTSREALVVFAENVEQVNGTLDKMKTSLETQRQLLAVNERLIERLDGLQDSVLGSNKALIKSLEKSNRKTQASNSDTMTKMSKAIGSNIANQVELLVQEINMSRKDIRSYMDKMVEDTSEEQQIEILKQNQVRLGTALRQINEQNTLLLKKFEDKENSISFP